MNILKLVFNAIDELNQDLDAGNQLLKSEDTVIFGTGSHLDSIDLVNLITIIEESLEEQTGEFIALADEQAMSLESSPFKTVGTLTAYISSLINK